MRFDSIRTFSPPFGAMVVKHSPIMPTLLLAVFGVSIVGMWWIVPTLWVRVVATIPLSLFCPALFGPAVRAFGPQNWWMVIDERNGVAVKFRSYLNAHFDPKDEVIVSLPFRELAWYRRTNERVITPSMGGSDGARRQADFILYLDLGLANVDTDELRRRLNIERDHPPVGRRMKSKAYDHRVRLVEANVLRIEFRSGRSLLRPSLKTVMASLQKFLPEKEEVKSEFNTLDKSKAEDSIIELLVRGDEMSATKVATRVYGMSLTEARKFVEELRGRAKGDAKDGSPVE